MSGPNALRRTEEANAARFEERHAGQHLFVAGTWLFWDGKHWVHDEGNAAAMRAMTALARQQAECAEGLVKALRQNDLPGQRRIVKEAQAELAWARRSANFTNVRNSLALASTKTALRCSTDDLDAHKWLLNCANGVVDLHTGVLQNHDQALRLTHLVPVAYDPKADQTGWRSFIDDLVGEQDGVAEFLQRAIGMSLVARPNKRLMVLLHGEGRNGKTTLIEAMKHIFGGYVRTAAPGCLMMKRAGAPTNDVADLRGARMVMSSETEDGAWLDAPTVKAMTGGDTQKSRFLYKEFFEFVPVFTIWLSTNNLPKLKASDSAMWSRIRLVPFNKIFKIDTGFASRLEAEYPGALAWAVEGCLDWQKHGAGGLNEPESMLAAKAGYKEDVDSLKMFLEECCIVGEGLKCTPAEMSAAYSTWCKENNVQRFGAQTLEKEMGVRGLYKKKSTGKRRWEGVAIGQVDQDRESGIIQTWALPAVRKSA